MPVSLPLDFGKSELLKKNNNKLPEPQNVVQLPELRIKSDTTGKGFFCCSGALSQVQQAQI